MPLHSGWSSALWLPAAGLLTGLSLTALNAARVAGCLFELTRRRRLRALQRKER